MSFPLGKPILAMSLIALLAGASVALREPAREKDLVLWVFADSHAETYRSIVGRFERKGFALVAAELYNLHLPVVLAQYDAIPDHALLRVDAMPTHATITWMTA